MTNLDKCVKELKAIGKYLIPYTFPMASLEFEKDIKILKQTEVTIDGYDVILSYSKADYEDSFSEILQIQPQYYPFLPFNLLCKIAVRFLGDKNLSLIEVIKDKKKLYCWILQTDKFDGSPIEPESKSSVKIYQNMKYYSINPDEVNFY